MALGLWREVRLLGAGHSERARGRVGVERVLRFVEAAHVAQRVADAPDEAHRVGERARALARHVEVDEVFVREPIAHTVPVCVRENPKHTVVACSTAVSRIQSCALVPVKSQVLVAVPIVGHGPEAAAGAREARRVVQTLSLLVVGYLHSALVCNCNGMVELLSDETHIVCACGHCTRACRSREYHS